MNTNKKEYESPKVKKMEFDFSEHVVASGPIPGHPTLLDEDGNPVIDVDHYVFSSDGGCTIYRGDDGCF